MATEGVKGMAEAMRQAEEGMKLFATSDSAESDVAGATAFKAEIDSKIAALEAEAAALTGKENKKARTEKEKEKGALKNQKDYIDACKVVKGLAPVHGHFLKSVSAPIASATPAPTSETAPAEAPAEAEKKEKKEKPKKAQESAGISKAERDELEGLKSKIIEKKAALKEQGLSGGQINKNEEVVAWVARMNELKEKENPGSQTAGKDDKKSEKKKKKLDSQSQAMLEEKQRALDEYTDKLKTEFKYSKKDIAADPEYQEMKAEIDKLSK